MKFSRRSVVIIITTSSFPCLVLVAAAFIILPRVQVVVSGFSLLPKSEYVYKYSSTRTNTNNVILMLASSRNNPDDAMTNSAPLYITVGPQCCGKTTFLKQQQQQQQILDISLDDQPDVYVPVETSIFMYPTNSSTLPFLQNTIHHGKSLYERIQNDNTELRLVLQRWKGDLSPQNFAIDMLQFYQQQGHSVQVAQALIRAVEEHVTRKSTSISSLSPPLPTRIQVFVLESLFRPHPSTQQSAIQRAHKLLRTTPLHIPVAWGNTNSKPRDYQMALEIACQTRRPVHFLICGAGTNNNSSSSSIGMPWVPLSTLLQRNLQRLADSGKYVPAFAIDDCCGRVEQLLQMAVGSQKPQNNGGTMDVDDEQRPPSNDTTTNTLRLEQYFVQLAEPPRSPQKQGNNNSNATTYRYRLTRNRLIQKEMTGSRHPTPPRNNRNDPGGYYERRSSFPLAQNGNGRPPNRNGGVGGYESGNFPPPSGRMGNRQEPPHGYYSQPRTASGNHRGDSSWMRQEDFSRDSSRGKRPFSSSHGEWRNEEGRHTATSDREDGRDPRRRAQEEQSNRNKRPRPNPQQQQQQQLQQQNNHNTSNTRRF